MYPKDRVIYFIVWTIDRFLNFGIFAVLLMILLFVIGAVLSFFNLFLGLIAAYVVFIVVLILKELIISISNIIPRLRNPYEPYGTAGVILSELPIVSLIYSMKGLFLNDFSKKMDSLSY